MERLPSNQLLRDCVPPTPDSLSPPKTGPSLPAPTTTRKERPGKLRPGLFRNVLNRFSSCRLEINYIIHAHIQCTYLHFSGRARTKFSSVLSAELRFAGSGRRRQWAGVSFIFHRDATTMGKLRIYSAGNDKFPVPSNYKRGFH